MVNKSHAVSQSAAAVRQGQQKNRVQQLRSSKSAISIDYSTEGFAAN